MGVLTDNTKEVGQAIQEKTQEFSQPRDFTPRTGPDSPNLTPTPVLPNHQPIRTIQTHDRIGTAELKNFSDNPMKLKILPMISTEVYAVDIVNKAGEVVYSVNAHSGEFSGSVPLPKGDYRCLIKTMKGDMPITVVQE